MMSKKQEQMVKTIDVNGHMSSWQDWRWQMRHAVKNLASFETALGKELDTATREHFDRTVQRFPMSVTPYYLSLIDSNNYANDPIFQQCFPSPRELITVDSEMVDPLHEDVDSPAPCVTHRYPDRVLFLVSNTCAMYCRHCTRKRTVGDHESIPSRDEMMAGINYIRDTPLVRDVLLSGGDPFMLSNDLLDWILTELRKIEHVEVIRIGTRTPVVLPQRITDSLVEVLKKHHPIWVNTHFNHPRELTTSSRRSLAKLANAGIPLGNQSVLLAGVNDCPRIMRSLVYKLVANRVRPYYLFQCDLSMGLNHFRTPVGKGIEIMESLIGHVSGFCVPTYVIDAPGGGGKIPVMPQYLISWSTNKVVLRNYEGIITTYKEPDSYEPVFCDRNCEACTLQLHVDDADERKALGIAQLMADDDDATSLVPVGNERFERRDEHEQ
jgi:lysine 2,3-aminomutase